MNGIADIDGLSSRHVFTYVVADVIRIRRSVGAELVSYHHQRAHQRYPASISDCVPTSRKTSRLKINPDEESHVTLLLFLQPRDDVTDYFHNILPGFSSLIELYLKRIFISEPRRVSD